MNVIDKSVQLAVYSCSVRQYKGYSRTIIRKFFFCFCFIANFTRYAQLSPGRSLFFKVHCLLGGRFYVLGIMKLVCDVCTFTGPMLLNKLISCFEDNPDVPVRYHAYAYATILG